MKTIKYFAIFATSSLLLFSAPSSSISKPLLYGGAKDEGNLTVFDPICMVTVLELVSYCSMDHHDSTGSACICHNPLRTFSGVVVTRQEYQALCRSWPNGSCSDLDQGPEISDVPKDEHLASKPETEPQPKISASPEVIISESTNSLNEPSVLQPDNPAGQQNDPAELIESRNTTVATIQKPIPPSPIEPIQLEPEKAEIDFKEILRRHPLRKFKRPNLLEIIKDLEKN